MPSRCSGNRCFVGRRAPRVHATSGPLPSRIRAESHRCRGPQLLARLHREAEIPAGAKTGTGALHGSHPGVAPGQAVARRGVRPVWRRAHHGRHRRERQRRPRAALGCARPHQVCRRRWIGDRTVYRRLELTRRTGCGVRPRAGQPSGASVASGYFGYEHAWSRVFTTAVTYGVVNVSNLDIQLEDAFHRTQRTSINLMWNPVPFVDIVVEFLAGTRVDKNGQRASSSQIQSGWTLKF